MPVTVGRRIALALAIELALLVIVAVIGANALGKTTERFESALAVRQMTVLPALVAESEDIDRVASIVDKLFSLLDKAARL